MKALQPESKLISYLYHTICTCKHADIIGTGAKVLVKECMIVSHCVIADRHTQPATNRVCTAVNPVYHRLTNHVLCLSNHSVTHSIRALVLYDVQRQRLYTCETTDCSCCFPLGVSASMVTVYTPSMSRHIVYNGI